MHRIEKWMLEISPEELPDPYANLALEIGLEATLKIAKEFGGETIYFKNLGTLVRKRRNLIISKEFNGYNIRQLATRYGITKERVKQILKNAKRI